MWQISVGNTRYEEKNKQTISPEQANPTLQAIHNQSGLGMVIKQINAGISKNAYLAAKEHLSEVLTHDCESVYPESTPGSLLRDQDIHYMTLANKARRKMHRSPCKCSVQ